MLYTTPRPSALRRVRARLQSIRFEFHPVVGGLMLILFGFHLLTFRPETWWGDSYQYLLHAENLLSGRAYTDTGYIPSPHNFIAPAAYPIGYPLLLAPLVSVFGSSPSGLALASSVLLVGTAWLTATLARGWLPDPFAAAIAVLVGLQPGLIVASRQPLSEPPFLFLVMLCLVAAERASYRTERWFRRAVVAGLALGLAASTRTLGLVLVPALLVPGLVRHRRWERPALVSIGIGVGVWVLLLLVRMRADLGAPVVAGAEGGAGYGALIQNDLLGRLGQIPSDVVARLADYTRASFPLWRVPGSDLLKNALFAAALVPVGIGLVHRVRRRFGPAEAFAGLYVLALLPWTFASTRYLFPLYPLYYLYLVVGVWRLGRGSWSRQWAASAALALAVGVSYGGRYLEWAVSPPSAVVAPNDEAIYQYLRATSPEDVVVLTTNDPRRSTYYTRRATSYGPESASEWTAYADRMGASYALVRDTSPVALDLAADARHRLLLRDGDLTLYRICPAACPADD